MGFHPSPPLSIIHPSSPCVCLVKQKGPRDGEKLLVNPLHPRWHTLNQHLSQKEELGESRKNTLWHSIESWLFNRSPIIIYNPHITGQFVIPYIPQRTRVFVHCSGNVSTSLEGWWRYMVVKQISTRHPPQKWSSYLCIPSQLLGESYCW